MASRLAIDKEQVRATYLATGCLKEAATLHGIKPGTVRQWAKRYEWETSRNAERLVEKSREIQALKRDMRHRDAVPICNTSEALGVSIEQNKKAFVTSMAGSLARASQEIEASPSALEHSRRMVDLAGAAKSILGIGADSDAPKLSVNLLSLDASALQLAQGKTLPL